jgi:hypothetical protein
MKAGIKPPPSRTGRRRSDLHKKETTMDETQRQSILAQIAEIVKRHDKADDETLGELLARAAASGDEEAIKLLEMEVGDIRM